MGAGVMPAAADDDTPVPALLGGGAHKGVELPSLSFDGASFESANLMSARLVSLQPVEYDLNIRPGTRASLPWPLAPRPLSVVPAYYAYTS